MKHGYIVWSIVLSFLALGGVAHAASAAPDSTVANRIAACGRLPLSERGICKDQAVLSAPSGAQGLSAEDQRTLAASNAAYDRAVADCNRLPLSERGICKVRPHAASVASAPEPQRNATYTGDARFKARLASCGRLPLSERTTCASEVGRKADSAVG